MPKPEDTLDRRDILGLMAGVSTGLATLAAAPSSAAPVKRAPPVDGPTVLGSETLKTTDGVTMFYKDAVSSAYTIPLAAKRAAS